MPHQREPNEATVQVLHHKIWNEVKSGNDEALENTLQLALALNCSISSMRSNRSPENNILTVTVCSGSVMYAQKIAKLVKVSRDASIYEGIELTSRSKRIAGGKSSCWISKPRRPFFHAVRSLGVPWKKISIKNQFIEEETKLDQNVVENFKTLLELVPEPH